MNVQICLNFNTATFFRAAIIQNDQINRISEFVFRQDDSHVGPNGEQASVDRQRGLCRTGRASLSQHFQKSPHSNR
jgi:hypothetical protein